MATNASSVEAATQAVEFGASMREMRRAHSRELAEAAATLKIRQVYLQAIEDGRFNALPGPTYATGFVRAYADYLGLDLVEVMRRYREITGDQPAQGPLVPPSPVVEARLPTGFILLVAAVLALAAYGGWYYLTVDGRDPVEVVTKLPARIAAMVGLDNGTSEKPPLPPTVNTDANEPAAAPSSTDTGSNPPSTETGTLTVSVSPTVGDPAITGEQTMSSASPQSASPQIDAVPAATASPIQVTVPSPAPNRETVSPSETTQQAVLPVEPVPPDTSLPKTPLTTTRPIKTPPPVEAVGRPIPAASLVPDQAVAALPESESQTPTFATPVLQLTPSAPQTDTATVSAALPESPAGSAFSAGRVILRASSITWVELRDASGKRLYSRLMKRGETFSVPPTGGVVLETGNAGGLDILVDGTAIASLGPQGAVRRGILLEPDSLLSGASGRR